MTVQQINAILFWTTLGIVALSVWLMFSAKKFGEQLAKKEKSAKTASSLRGVPILSGRRGNLKPKRNEAK